MKGRRRGRRREHKDSSYVSGAGKVTFSRGRNGFCARVDGEKRVLKKKVREYVR